MSILEFVFRRPRFPIICAIDGELVAGGNLQQFERRLAKVQVPISRAFDIVDATGESWKLHLEFNAISPLTLDKQWTKARVIRMFNESKNAQRSGLQYAPGSLSNRRLDVVIRDVANLIGQAERSAEGDG